MFYESEKTLISFIKNSGTTIVVGVLNEDFVNQNFKNAQIIKPGMAKNESGKPINSITPDQIREIINASSVKQLTPQYFFIEHAEKMQESAQDVALKLLEEPKENYHYILYVTSPEALLQTIRSRATILAPKKINTLDEAPAAPEDIKTVARRLLVAKKDEIIDIADELNKFKEKNGISKRENALNILSCTIEMAEKSYFKTKNDAFLSKIDGLIAAYDAISQNCNLKLQLVASLI